MAIMPAVLPMKITAPDIAAIDSTARIPQPAVYAKDFGRFFAETFQRLQGFQRFRSFRHTNEKSCFRNRSGELRKNFWPVFCGKIGRDLGNSQDLDF